MPLHLKLPSDIMAQGNIKKMEAIHSTTLRGIMEAANSKRIQKEDIVQVLESGDGYVLLYYK